MKKSTRQHLLWLDLPDRVVSPRSPFCKCITMERDPGAPGHSGDFPPNVCKSDETTFHLAIWAMRVPRQRRECGAFWWKVLALQKSNSAGKWNVGQGARRQATGHRAQTTRANNCIASFGHSIFVIHSSFGFRHSTFTPTRVGVALEYSNVTGAEKRDFLEEKWFETNRACWNTPTRKNRIVRTDVAIVSRYRDVPSGGEAGNPCELRTFSRRACRNMTTRRVNIAGSSFVRRIVIRVVFPRLGTNLESASQPERIGPATLAR